MSDDLRDRIADAIPAELTATPHVGVGSARRLKIADAVMAVITAELRRATGMSDNIGDLLELGADEILAALRENEAVLHDKERRAQEAEAALDRVREIHTSSYETRGVGRYSSQAPHGAYCEHCGHDHPCPTVRATDTEETP